MVNQIVSNILESNVFVAGNENFCFVVDAGADIDKVLAMVGGRKVEAIFLTHGHYDHCMFVQEYAKKFDCKIFASEKIKQYLTNPEYNYSDGALSISDFSDFKFLRGDGKINLPHFEIQFFSLGGHSKSDVCFLWQDQLFVGDVLIGRDIGRMDLFGGDKIDMQKSLGILQKLNYRLMHCGHGADFEKSTQDKVCALWIKFLSR